jgi:hypothetical protein
VFIQNLPSEKHALAFGFELCFYDLASIREMDTGLQRNRTLPREVMRGWQGSRTRRYTFVNTDFGLAGACGAAFGSLRILTPDDFHQPASVTLSGSWVRTSSAGGLQFAGARSASAAEAAHRCSPWVTRSSTAVSFDLQFNRAQVAQAKESK